MSDAVPGSRVTEIHPSHPRRDEHMAERVGVQCDNTTPGLQADKKLGKLNVSFLTTVFKSVLL